MNTAARVTKNTGAIIAGDMVNKAIGLIILISLARYLGSTEFGRYSFIFAFIFLFGIIADLGVNIIVVREISRDRSIAEKMLGNALALKIFLSAAAIVLSLLTVNLLNYPESTKILVYIASFSLFISSLTGIYGSMFRVLLEMKYAVVAGIIGQICLVTLIFIIIALKGTLYHMISATVIANAIGLLFTFLFSRRFAIPKLELDIQYIKNILKPAIVLGLSGVFVIIYYRIDIIMLSLMQNDTVVGYYSAAYRLIDPFIFIPMAFMASLFPLMSQYFKSSPSTNKLVDTYTLSLKYMILIAFPIAIGVTLLSENIILIVFGDEFSPAGAALSVLIWSTVFIFTNIVFSTVLISINKEKTITFISAIMMALNIIANYILIPQLSYVGASIATVFTQAFGSVVCFFYLTKIFAGFDMKSFSMVILKIVLAGLVLYLFLTEFDFMPLYLLISVSAVIYISLLLVSGCISREEIRMIKSAIFSR
jgi:O-antigen/teichoic acid export membrane protein